MMTKLGVTSHDLNQDNKTKTKQADEKIIKKDLPGAIKFDTLTAKLTKNNKNS